MNLGLHGSDGTSREYPIDDAPSIKQRPWRCCSDTLIRECVSKLRAANVGTSSRPGNIQIKIACQNDRNGRFVLVNIVQALLQLGAAQTVIATTLKMKVVSYQGLPSKVDFTH